MSAPVVMLLAVAVFLSTMSIEYAATRYTRAVQELDERSAGNWSVTWWAASAVGFVVAVKCTLLVLPAEAAGIYLGARFGVRSLRRKREP